MSSQMMELIQQKDKESKAVKQQIKKRMRILKGLAEKSIDLENSRSKLEEITSGNFQYSSNVGTSSLKVSKEVNRLMTERVDLMNLQKKINEDIKFLTVKKRRINAEINYENDQLQKLKKKISSYSNTYERDRKLSESVDLGQSRLENFLNVERETKQGLLSEVNNTKRRIRRIKSINKSFNSKKFISSDFDNESMQSEDSQFGNFDFVDLTNENNQLVFDKDFFKNTGRNTAELQTLPTRRSNQAASDIDVKSLTEKNEVQKKPYVPKMSRRSQAAPPAKAPVYKVEENDDDYSIGTLSQWHKRDIEEIPEVPEEASSANITPRRMEEENEEILKLAEEKRNTSPLFGASKQDEIFEDEKCFFVDPNPDIVTKFNIDKEIELPKDAEMNISVLSSFDESPEGNPNVLSACDISFTSNNFQNVNISENITKLPPKIPMLNLAKVKPSSNLGHKPRLSLNLSAISVNQSVNDTTKETIPASTYYKECKRSRNNEHQRFESNRTIATTQNSAKREETSLCDSFINDANMITEIFENKHSRKVSNLELTFEKSIEKDKNSKVESLKALHYKKNKSKFTGSHWNFGSKRPRVEKEGRLHKYK